MCFVNDTATTEVYTLSLHDALPIYGTGTSASFNLPHGITTDGTNLYVADMSNHLIRKIE